MATRTTRAQRTAIREGDQYLLRLPPGMRERLEQRAAANGRAIAAEVIEAIEKHLTSADRVTQLWELFQKHQQDIEDIPVISTAVEYIEGYLAEVWDGKGDPPQGLSARRWRREQKRHAEYVATLPLVTPDQVQIIKALLKERPPGWEGSAEKHLLRIMGVPRLEDIRGFERAMNSLGEQIPIRTLTADQVQTIKALLKETDSDEKSLLAAMGVPQLEDIRGFERALKLLGERLSNRTPT